MRKLILLFLFVLTMFGCSEIASTKECYQSLQETFPTATVFRLPDENFKFIVITDSTSYYVETMSTGTDITVKIRIK